MLRMSESKETSSSSVPAPSAESEVIKNIKSEIKDILQKKLPEIIGTVSSDMVYLKADGIKKVKDANIKIKAVVAIADKNEVVLDLASPAKKIEKSGYAPQPGMADLLHIAVIANDLPWIDRLLADAFHPSKIKCTESTDYENLNAMLQNVQSYQTVESFLKYGMFRIYSNERARNYFTGALKNQYIAFANLHTLKFEVKSNGFQLKLPEEKECKQIQFKTDRSGQLIKLPSVIKEKQKSVADVEIHFFALYNFGAAIINSDPGLLENYNLIPQTNTGYDDLGVLAVPKIGHLKLLYILSVALKKLPFENIFQIRQSYDWLREGHCSSITFPNGCTLRSAKSLIEILAAYMSVHAGEFAKFGKLPSYNLFYNFGSFTGKIPHFNYIDSENLIAVSQSLFSDKPEVDLIAALRTEADKPQQTVSISREDYSVALKILDSAEAKEKAAAEERKRIAEDKAKQDELRNAELEAHIKAQMEAELETQMKELRAKLELQAKAKLEAAVIKAKEEAELKAKAATSQSTDASIMTMLGTLNANITQGFNKVSTKLDTVSDDVTLARVAVTASTTPVLLDVSEEKEHSKSLRRPFL